MRPEDRLPDREYRRLRAPRAHPEEFRDQKTVDPNSPRGLTSALADVITTEDHFAQDAGGKLYHYRDGAYRQHGERYIRRRVKEVLDDSGLSGKWSTHRANEVVEYIRVDAPELWEKPPTDRINVLNGILDLENGEMIDHYPEFLSAVQLPVRYDPEAGCPAWDAFVKQTFPEDAQDLAWEIVGWLMTPDTSIQKAILLVGEGANGKSLASTSRAPAPSRRSPAGTRSWRSTSTETPST